MSPDRSGPARPPASAAAEAAGVDVPVPVYGPVSYAVLDPERAALLEQWCADLIPAGAGRPSAAQAGAPRYIDRVCSSSPVLRCALVVALDALAAAAAGQHGRPFAQCSAAQRTAVLEAFSAADPHAFGLIRGLTYEAYYATPTVLAGLERATGWRATNTVAGGPMDPFDESLLDRVRTLPSGYRPAASAPADQDPADQDPADQDPAGR